MKDMYNFVLEEAQRDFERFVNETIEKDAGLLSSVVGGVKSFLGLGKKPPSIKTVQDVFNHFRSLTWEAKQAILNKLRAMGFDPTAKKLLGMLEKTSAVKGMVTHKGKTVPKEVLSLRKRLEKKYPGKSEEYYWRTAWDIYASYVSGEKKSRYSGLKRAGGETELPLSKGK